MPIFFFDQMKSVKEHARNLFIQIFKDFEGEFQKCLHLSHKRSLLNDILL
jgi:hypothetical protein